MKKTTNISATHYNGQFQVLFDCSGAEACAHALCPIMPPEGSDECAYREHGSCINPQAQIAAIEQLRNKLAGELRKRKDDDE